ncbi:MAG: hypothetical protein MK132_02600 [Lentisphaerales bacterium]|nr:hypothetical protein [Lentisphaerales bacterium]
MSATANIVSHGPLLKCKCPGCKENQEFHLTEKTTQSSLLKKMMLFGDREEWNLVCQSCDYHHKVPKPEGSAVLHALMPLKEENTPENLQKFETTMNQMSFLAELFNDSMSWICAKCNETVAHNFQACWNCSAPHPGYEGGDEPPRFIPPMGG